MKLNALIAAFRARAGDTMPVADFSNGYIRDLLNSALHEHVALRLDLYGTYEQIELKTGDLQTIPDCWDYFGAVDAIVTAQGVKIASVNTNTDADAASLFKSCSPAIESGRNRMQSATATIPKNAARTFMIDPPVAPGQKLYARVLVAKAPKPFRRYTDDIALTSAQYEDLLKYAVGTALALAPDSPSDNARGERQISSFVQGSAYKQKALAAWRKTK